MSENIKLPLTAEIVSETGDGKTHGAAVLFPDPVFIDTTDTMETPLTLKKIYPDWRSRWIQCKSWKDIEEAVKQITDNGKFKTVVFDVSKDLQRFAIPQWAKEAGRKRPMPYEYDEVRDYGRSLFARITRSGRNVVACSQMKDEIIGDKSTGGRIPDSFKPLPMAARLIIFIRRGSPNSDGTIPRQYKVIKNASRDSADPKDWIQILEGIKAGLTEQDRQSNWAIIKNLMKLQNGEACE